MQRPTSLTRSTTLFTLLALTLLIGCTNTVRTRTSTFLAPEATFRHGTIAVQPADAELAESLEFALYRDKLEQRLQRAGYTLAAPETAEYIARLSYSVVDPREQDAAALDSRRNRVGFTTYWMTGFGPYYPHRALFPPFYRHRRDLFLSDPFFDPPPFGYHRRFAYDPWSYDPYDRRYGWRYAERVEHYRPEFLRKVNLHITRTPQAGQDKPRKIYEVKAVSAGSCPTMSVVFDEMLAAIFNDFPGENGAVKTVRVEGETRCH